MTLDELIPEYLRERASLERRKDTVRLKALHTFVSVAEQKLLDDEGNVDYSKLNDDDIRSAVKAGIVSGLVETTKNYFGAQRHVEELMFSYMGLDDDRIDAFFDENKGGANDIAYLGLVNKGLGMLEQLRFLPRKARKLDESKKDEILTALGITDNVYVDMIRKLDMAELIEVSLHGGNVLQYVQEQNKPYLKRR